MSRKKEHGHVNHERWLVSYADFITLLFAFFVVLFASSQADKNKQAQIAAAMQMAFTPLGGFEAHAKTPPLEATSGSSPVTKPAALAMPFPQMGRVTPAEEKIESRLNEMIRQAAAKLPEGSITTRVTPEGLVVSLHEIGFFASGSAGVRKESTPTLRALAAMLPDSPLRVEGHTDNVPIHTSRYSSNWELSTARASMIARFLLEHGTMHPNHVAAAGYAEFHPVASNATAQGRSQNRRVDIILLRSPTPSQ
ncbi:flagellar motor protein MotB [Edaphobacter albus]|uniref:flagellar motor protein MotB n=1 Tax=Edaphobacter sp. 4G125 TaxID=2763071 RepID=UPI0016469BFD|nr:flagellar motor protein MotB [Edaphobacter sp. 4G125]QNI38282.1 OmpA family protein [Edaphobacter sp. 4G125]